MAFTNSIMDAYHSFSSGYHDVMSKHYLTRMGRRRKGTAPVRVGFIAQMKEVWNKEEPVYRFMKGDARFATEILVIPPFDMLSQKVATVYPDDSFLEYDDAVMAYDDGRWLDITDRYDYLFYQRPYDQYLPEMYRTSEMVKYTKCCYIPYGFSISDDFHDEELNRHFFRNIYFPFMESEHMLNEHRKMYPDGCYHARYLGYPAFEPYYDVKPLGEVKRVMWTPRWSYDERVGGSRFMEYRDLIPSFAEKYDIQLTFRPHPLLFDEMVRTGRMTRDEIGLYLKRLDEAGIIYDSGSDLFDALRNTDVLITDLSSVVIEYFITGRPIIYCEAGMDLNEIFRKISQGFYIAYCEDDVVRYMDMIQNGDDVLSEKRQELIRDYMMDHRDSSKKIAECIYTDHTGH